MNDKVMISALIMVIASLLKSKREYDNHEIVELIEKWVRSEMGRAALKRHMIDDVSIESISEEIDRSPRQTARIIKKARQELQSHMS
ncbi:MAG: hypothetical protein IJP92_00880 [Lachnospiraceae bacterium]|nr:hypothetical protein [Lachnospiraceae bacterium]